MSTERTDDKEHFDTPGRAERRPAGEGEHAPAPQRPPAPGGRPPGMQLPQRSRRTCRDSRRSGGPERPSAERGSRRPPVLSVAGRTAADTPAPPRAPAALRTLGRVTAGVSWALWR